VKGSLFSDSWFKVAKLHASLNSSVEIQKQLYRGETWYVVRSSFGGEFYRITPETYDFIATLTTDVTIEEHWERFLDQYEGAAPTQDEVIHVLSDLYAHNLLYFKNVPNVGHIFERRTEKKRKERVNALISLLSIKIPLFNPDSLLTSLSPLFKYLFGFPAFIIWLVVIIFGGKAAVGEWSQIADASQGMLAPGNLVFMYAALVIMKLAHESAHAAATKHFGGSVRTVGLMFLVLTPLPYMDASDSWFFQERRQRMLVSAAGMLFDLFAAALAAMIWAATGDGAVHGVAFNVMILGSISSIFFNGNPLIRFDAYYLLADLLEIPNLYERARQIWFYLFERYLFNVKLGEIPAEDTREGCWLILYGAASFIYRCILSVTILLLVADRFLFLGVLLFFVSLVVGVVLPIKRFMTFLSGSQRLFGVRGRAVAISALMAIVVVVLVGFIPLPRTIYAPGIVELVGYKKVYAATEGRLERIYIKNGDFVKKDQVIAELSNYDLDRDLDVTVSRISQNETMKQKAHFEATADLKPLMERGTLLHDQLKHLKQRKSELQVIAESAGIFVSPSILSYQGRWLKRQTQIGSLVAEGDAKFLAVVSQDQAFDLFKEKYYHGLVKLFGSPKHPLLISGIAVNPYQKDELPSAALGWLGGGEVAVSTTDRSGKKTTESFYELSGTLKPQNDPVSPKVLHGRAGILRISLPSQTFFHLAIMKVRQTLQKRYKI